MKNYLFFLCLFFCSSSLSQTVRTISLSYDNSDFSISDDGNGLSHINSSNKTFVFKSDTLSPALPFVCVNILIGPQEKMVSFTTDFSESLYSEGLNLSPNPVTYKTSDIERLFTPSQLAPVYRAINYPETYAEFTGEYSDGPYNFVTFLVCPFRYDAAKKNLYLRNSIDLNLKLTSSRLKASISNNQLSGNVDQIRSIVVNKEDFDALYGTLPNDRKFYSVNSVAFSDYPFKYLIITRDSVKNEYQRLADWKTKKGIKAKVVTVEEISEDYATENLPIEQKIKKTIKQYYNDGCEYVLLGGDIRLIPSPECFIKTYCDGDLYTGTPPVDLYYACLTDIDWNHNGNTIIGETTDSINIYPNIAVTRLPSVTVVDAKNIVDKIIDYEKSPVWNNTLLMCGVDTGNGLFYHNGTLVSNEQCQGDELYSNHISPYWNGTCYRFYDTDTDFSGGADYNVSRENLQNELSKGYSIVNMGTHGNYLLWTTEGNGQNYTSDNAAELVGQAHSFIFTSACSTNAYDCSNRCLGPTFMRNKDDKVLAYYGSTRENWGFSGTDLGPDKQYLSSFYKYLLCYGQPIGKAVTRSKIDKLANCGSYNDYRWLHFALTPLCDPEMSVYSDIPQQFPDFSIIFNNGYFNIVNNNPHLTKCISSKFDNGESFYYKDMDLPEGGFVGLNDEYSLCITDLGYIPYQATFGKTVHLQNEVIQGQYHVYGDKVLIGSGIIDDIEQGPVVVKDGSTTIHSNTDVIITNDFEVKKGAEFTIGTN